MKNEPQTEQSKTTGPPAHGWPALTIDWDLLGQCLEDSDLTDDEIQETIEAYWAIAVCMVDLSLGIHPAQMATKSACEQNRQNGNSNPDELPDLVNCLNMPSPQKGLQTSLQSSFKSSLADFAACAHNDGNVETGRNTQKERNSQ